MLAIVYHKSDGNIKSVYIFSDDTYFSTKLFILLSHNLLVNFYFWRPFLLFFYIFFCLSIQFPIQNKFRNWTSDINVYSAMYIVFLSFWCIFCFLSMFLYGIKSLKVTILIISWYQGINPTSNHPNSNS